MRQTWSLYRTISIVVLISAIGILLGTSRSISSLHAAGNAAPVHVGSIQGLLLQFNGTPAANAVVTLQTVPGRGQAPVLVGTANTDAKGKFTFTNVAVGTYDAQAVWLSIGTSKRTTVFKGATSSVILMLPNNLVQIQGAAKQ